MTSPSGEPALGGAAHGEPATRLLLICHGEGLYDRFTNLARHLVTDEGGLSAVGWDQANTLATWLADRESVDFLVSGNQLRSRLTGQRISQVLGTPLTILPNLPGHLNPNRGEDPLPPKNPLPQPPTVGGSGSGQDSLLSTEESTASQTAFFGQILTALDQTLAGHWGKTIALISHSEVIAALIGSFFGSQSMDVHLDNTSISELRWVGDRWQLIYVNRREHIPCPRVQPVASRARRPESGEVDAHLEDVRKLFNRVAPIYARSKQATDLQRIQDLVNFADLPDHMEILDVGTGPGTLALALVNDGAELVLGVDISEAMLEQAEYLRLSTAPADQATRLGFRLAPAHHLPFDDERFDVVFCRLVLQYLTHPKHAIEEMVRVLKPGGVLILAELLSVDDAVKRATQNAIEERRDLGHVAARSADQYDKLISAAGLVVEQVETKHFDREVEEWLSSLDTAPADQAAVREMLEAGVETDAAGLNARHVGDTLVFDQRMIYLKAVKPK